MSDCGCDEADDFAALAALNEDEADLAPDPRGNELTKWGPDLIAPYNVPTGDKRRFAQDSLTNRELPLPLKWQRVDAQGHSTSVTVGTIEGIDYREDGVYAWGILLDPDPEKLPRLAEDVGEAKLLLERQAIGPSVDLDDMDFHTLEPVGEMATADARPEIEVTKGRISAATLVQVPAFTQARPFKLSQISAEDYAASQTDRVVTASGVASGLAELPIADGDWDPLAWMSSGDTDGVLYDRGDAVLFPVAARVEGQLALYPAAVADAISVLAYRDPQLPEPVKTALRFQLEELADRCNLPEPPWGTRTASLVASADAPRDWKPKRSDFEDPKFDKLTPVTVKDGRVFGHLASWKSCHIGFANKCVQAPRSRSNYAYFHVGEIMTDDGPLAVGKITLGGGHADERLGFKAAAEHYDDAGTAVAIARVGEDKFGIWFSGVPMPGAEDRFSTLPLFPLSGDWRRVGGSMELVAALAVNTPGFGILRTHEYAGQTLALVAAGVLAAPEGYDDGDQADDQADDSADDFANLSMKGREASAKKHHALPDGSFPIENVSDLQNAISAYGRAKDKEAAKRLIMRRARELKREDLIPDSWKGDSGGSGDSSNYAIEERQAARRAEWVASLAGTLADDMSDLEELERREIALQASQVF